MKPNVPYTLLAGLSGWLVPLLLWLGAGLAANLGAWKIVDRLLTPAAESPSSAPALPEALRGQTITVPAGAGFWPLPLASANAVALARRAEPDGHAVSINLCLQRKLRHDAPMQIYPIALAGDWAALRDARSTGEDEVRRMPLIVAPDIAQAMPRLTIRGNYRGVLTAKVRPGTGTGGWTLLFAEATGAEHVLAGESWLLWRAAGDDPAGYNRALRLRRLPDGAQNHPACREPTERLEFQLFRAADAQAARMSADISVAIGQDRPLALRLPAGTHTLPSAQPAPAEDRALFERSLAMGLLRHESSGEIRWAPADAARARAQGVPLADWASLDFSGMDVAATHKALHRSANGAFLRARIEDFNRQRSWLAVRVRPVGNPIDWTDVNRWRAEQGHQTLRITTGLPEVAARLFERPPVGFGDWMRIESNTPTENATVRMTVTPPTTAPTGQRIELLVLGQVRGVRGATVVGRRPACEGTGCIDRDMLTLLELQLGQKPKGAIELTLSPDPRFNGLHPGEADAARIQLRDGRLVWMDVPPRQATNARAEVVVLARDGMPLFKHGEATDMASILGVAETIGIASAHEHSVAGSLSRLGQHGIAQVSATTTIDPEWQTIADGVLECVGQREGHWEVASFSCINGKPDAVLSARRRSALVLMDAVNGDILAAAGAPHLPEGTSPAEAIAFSRFNPAANPLRANAWQHDGGVDHAPGSAFKLVDGLALEAWAAAAPARQRLLEGMPPAELAVQGAALGFRPGESCYPAPCGRLAIANYHHGRPSAYLRDGRFGLVEALTHSVNTWFAWMAETSDATTAIRTPGALPQPLGRGALDEVRPVLAMAHRLGFGKAERLDGGLLPANFAWSSADHLQTTPSSFDPVADPHQIRQQAIGQRTQVTALQMAEVAAAIATGRTVAPRLLLALNDQRARDGTGEELGVNLDRIRRGMKAVVDNGTARAAFAAPTLAALRGGVFAKTGTAELISGSKHGRGGATAGNVVSFVGYIAANTLPNQPHPLAFAVSIGHTQKKAGEHAAKVVAEMLISRMNRINDAIASNR